MTTPAVNRTEPLLLVGGGSSTKYPDGHVVTTTNTSSVYQAWSSTQRPKSVTNHANPITGWRSPSAWYHYGCRVRLPVGEAIAYNYPANGYITTRFGSTASDNSSGATFPSWPSTSTIEGKAVNMALNNLKNQHVNLADDFATRSQIADLCVHSIELTADAIRAFKRRDFSAWKWMKKHRASSVSQRVRNLQKIPESYLEFVYGVQPLKADIYGAADALREKDNGRPYIVTVKGYGSQRHDLVTTKGVAFGLFRNVERITQRCMVRLDYYYTNPILSSLSQVGITNPLAVAWDLVPYSFVLDWFAPIGDWLGLLDASLGFQFKSGSKSVIQKSQTTSSTFKPSLVGYPPSPSLWTGSNYQRTAFKMDRTLYGSSPWAQVYWKNPFPKNGVHIANALALAAAAFR